MLFSNFWVSLLSSLLTSMDVPVWRPAVLGAGELMGVLDWEMGAGAGSWYRIALVVVLGFYV